MRLNLTLIVLALAAALAIGCGSSGSSGSGSGASSGSSATDSSTASSGGDSSSGGESNGGAKVKAEFTQEGDAICQRVPTEYGKKAKALEAEAKKSNKPKPSKSETTLKAAVPPLYVAAEAFEELTPPEGDEEEIEAIIAALESAAEGLEAEPEAEFSGTKSPFAEFQKLTKAYGFRSCSQL
jgi:hypothetical protein